MSALKAIFFIWLLLSLLTDSKLVAQTKAEAASLKTYRTLLIKADELQNKQNLPDSSIILLIKAKGIARSLSDKHILAQAHLRLAHSYYWAIADYYKCKKELDTIGNNYFSILTNTEKCQYLSRYGDAIYYDNDYVGSLQYYFKALAYVGTDSVMLARLYHNIGWVYTDLKNYAKGIEFGEKALLVAQQANGDVTHKLQGLVYIYKTARQFSKALDYQNKLLASDTDRVQMAFNYYRKISIYADMKQYDSALYYGEKGIYYGKKPGGARNLMMLLDVQLASCIHGKRMEHFDEYLKQYEALLVQYNKPYDANGIYALAGEYYLQQKDYAKSRSYLEKAKQLQEQYNLVGIEYTYLSLAVWHETKNEHDLAYGYLKKYAAIQDSVLMQEREHTQKTMDNYSKIYDLENTLTQNETEIQAKNELLQKEKTQKYMVLAGLVFVILVAGFFFKLIVDRKKMTRQLIKNSRVIELKNELLSERSKEIHDSISYAKYLQNAILPSGKLIKENLKNSFVFYKPKDMVAGDFYWLELCDADKDLVLFAAADCTGHGVPGAMVSVVCSNALNRAVKEFALCDPGKILDKVRELVIETFSKSEDEVKDGMDISLCVLNYKTHELHWAGANNPLWIIRNYKEKEQEYELIEYKGNKQPIGKTENPEPFTTHKVQLQAGDSFYLITDGYADQFGGEKGKKMKTANFKKLLLSIQSKSMGEQYVAIEQSLEEWRGDHEQVDDICVIGVRI
ncbi:MAG: SpoIIE family protein phosphatase [Bacteroidota bacterium]